MNKRTKAISIGTTILGFAGFLTGIVLEMSDITIPPNWVLPLFLICGILALLGISIFIWSSYIWPSLENNIRRRLSEQQVTIKEPDLPGRYFIGIDIGRDKIDYCLIDHDNLVPGKCADRDLKLVEGERRPTPRPFRSIYNGLVHIVDELCQKAPNDVRKIHGIGLGLPGQVDPSRGQLVKSPGFNEVDNEPVIENLIGSLRANLRKYAILPLDELTFGIDNDVRCATRWMWKAHSYDDVICIFVGMGLGSGIVLDGRMLYGYNFTAGEIGHTTISECDELIGEERCKCGLEGCHWETCANSDGMIRIAKKLSPTEYNRLKTEYEEIIKEVEYQKLLENEAFNKYQENHFDEKNELTTYFFSLAFRAKEDYAGRVVEQYIKYLAIGIANYINIINPETVHLGGGMISAFYNDTDIIPHLNCTTKDLLHREIRKYALPSASQVAIVKRDYTETRIASIGAALMLKDQTYFNHINTTASGA